MRNTNNIAAIILAGGYSSRMGRFKPLLPLAGQRTAVETAVRCFSKAGVKTITVVTGHASDSLVPVLDSLGVRQVHNEGYAGGMFTSVAVGIRSLAPDIEACFILPVDIPLIKSHTIKLLCRALKRTDASVVYPVFQNRRGHPPLITAACFPAILSGAPAGLRSVLADYEQSACELAVLDEGVLLDMDIPADYQAMCRRAANGNVPSEAECMAILATQKMPEPVIRHSTCVAAVAGRLAAALNRNGFTVDAGLAAMAGRLHDIAKGRDQHARQGARILRSLGYGQLADIVAVHTDGGFDESGLLSEAAIVFLADKLVKGDRVVSLEERFGEPLEKFAANAEILAAIRRRFCIARAVAARVEQAAGAQLADVLAGLE